MAGDQDPLGEVLGSRADALSALAPVVREKVLTGLESLTANRPALEEVSFGMADPVGLSAELATSDHLGMELTMSAPGGARFLGAVFVALPDVGAMLAIETGAERMADEDFARAQLEMISAATREFFDLMTMTLFVDDLQGLEVVPAPARTGDPEAIVGLVAEAAEGAPVARMDVALTLASGAPARMVLLVPQPFLDAFGDLAGAMASPGGADMDDDALFTDPLDEIVEPTPLRGTMPPPSLLEGDEPAEKVSPLRPAGTFGAGARDDVDVHPVRFPPLTDVSPGLAERRSLDLIMDVSMRVTVELGRSTLTVEDVLSLGPGSVVELNKLAGEPVDVLVNEQLIARGEVVVVDENFGVRVTEIVSPRRRAQAMGA